MSASRACRVCYRAPLQGLSPIHCMRNVGAEALTPKEERHMKPETTARDDAMSRA